MVIENIVEICVAFDIAILGIAYPIIVDKISNIGDKYASEYIPEIFNNEFPQKEIKIFEFKKREYRISVFKLTLFVTIFSFIFLIFKIEPFFDNWFLNNSANLFVVFLSVLLIIFFFIWLGKVALYNGKSKSLLTHLIKSYNNLKVTTEVGSYHLKAINELAFYAIEKQDEHIQETLLNFYFSVFSKIRMNHNKTKPLVYPIDLYILVNKLNEIAVEKETKLKAIEHRAVSGNWLLGEDFEEIEISEETYRSLWSNIYTICDNPRFVKMFWGNSNNYFQYRLREVDTVYDFKLNIVLNKIHVAKRYEERKRFVEFHYALGGLLLYRNQYKVLKYLFEYSQSQPPQYVLLPETMTTIFEWFDHFSNQFKHRLPIDMKYFYPELDNLGNRSQVNYWICSYISILFLKQYLLHQYYTFQDFKAQPTLPNDVLELSSWLDNVAHFERCLNDVLSNKELIADLGFIQLIEEKRTEFYSFLLNLKVAIKNKIGEQKLQAELSTKKINEFYSQSSAIISKAFEDYQPIFLTKSKEHSKSEFKLNINGERVLMSKSAFTNNDISILNYDTFFAEHIATKKVKRIIPNAFVRARTRGYLLNGDNVIQALTKIIGKNNEIVVVVVNAGFQLRETLETSSFKSYVKYIPSKEYESQNSLFVLRKDDLPAIEYKQLREEEIEELQLYPINEGLKIYASVIDINTEKNKSIKDKWNLDDEPDNQDLKVQVAIAFQSIIYFKNDREIIQINIASEYREQGIQNDINDVEPLKLLPQNS